MLKTLAAAAFAFLSHQTILKAVIATGLAIAMIAALTEPASTFGTVSFLACPDTG